MNNETEYEPFGPEWAAQMLKMKKEDLVHLFKASQTESINLKVRNARLLEALKGLLLVIDELKYEGAILYSGDKNRIAKAHAAIAENEQK